MSEPGGASEVGHIQAVLSWQLDVWARQLAQIKRDVRDVGSLNANIRISTNSAEVAAQLALLRRQADEVGNQRPNIQVRSNAKESTFEMHALRDSILLIGPAAIPVGAVLVGALAGAIPVVASLALGVAGISEEFKSGALQGSGYAKMIGQVKSEFGDLKAIAAGGLLPGLDQAWQNSSALVRVFNSDIGETSTQLGEIVSHGAPALLSILTQLNPLFVTFGNELVSGATHLEHWASSTTGIHSFVAYVQSELPAVEHTIGSLVELFVHLSAGLGPLGHVALTSLGVIADILNSLPIGVLGKLETGVLAVYFAFRTYSAINAIVRGVNSAVTSMTAPVVAHRAVVAAAAAANANSAAQEAAAVERAALAEAEAQQAAATAALQAATRRAASGSTVALAARAEARAVAASAEEQVAAQRLAAAGAEANAERTAVASAAAAAAVTANGERAALGWSAMLGPVGALAAGIAILGISFLGTGHNAQTAAQANDTYAESVKKSTDALNEANLAATAKNLSDGGELKTLADLKSKNRDLSVSFGDLAQAINGPQKAFDKTTASLKALAEAHSYLTSSGRGATTKNYDEEGQAALGLVDKLTTLRGTLGKNIREQELLNQAMRASQAFADGGSAAAHRQAAALGMTGKAYLDAQLAAKQNTLQTQAQTHAWQLANDALDLLEQSLDKANGKTISYAQANNTFQQQLVSLQKGLHDGSKAFKGNTEGAIANRASLIGLVQSAQQTAEAYVNLKQPIDGGRAKMEQLRQTIIDNAVAQGANRKAVTDYVDSLFKIPKTIPKTTMQVDKAEAADKLKTLQEQLNAVKQTLPILVGADADAARTIIADLQSQIDNLHGKQVDIDVAVSASHSQQEHSTDPHHAKGGSVHGKESGDNVPIMATNDEFVSTVKSAHRNKAALEAANRGATLEAHFAAGGTVGGGTGVVTINPTSADKKAAKAATSAAASSDKADAQAEAQRQARLLSDAQAGLQAIGQATQRQINLATSSAARIIAQIAKAGANLSADIADGLDPKKVKGLEAELTHLAESAQHQLQQLKIHIDKTDLANLDKAVKGTVEGERQAFASLLDDARRAGVGAATLARITAENREITQKMNQREAVEARLGTRVKDNRTAYEKLNDDRQTRRDLESSVKGAVTGTFDIGTAGTNPVSGKVTSGSLEAQAHQAAAIAKKYVDGVEELEKEGLNAADIARLESEGPSAWPEVQQLLKGGKRTIHSINVSERSLALSGARLGRDAASTSGIDRSIANDQKLVTQLTKRDQQLTHQIGTLSGDVGRAVRKELQGMRWTLKIGPGGAAELVTEGNRQIARRGGDSGAH